MKLATEMEKRKAKRVHRKESPLSERQLQKWRSQITDELPDLIRRDRLADEALKEKTFSGRLRRAINAFPISPMKTAQSAEISWEDLDDFLTGEKPLTSDAIDRPVAVVKLKLPAVKAPQRRAKAG